MPQTFSAHEWIVHRFQCASLSPECLKSVENFTLMWGMFESLYCGNDAKIGKFQRRSNEIDQAAESWGKIQNSFEYFKNRYRTSSGWSDKFDNLNFRDNDRRDIVEEALLSNGSNGQLVSFALLIIIYRFRNNLFHGLKSIASLNEQTENLNIAAETLSAIMEALGQGFLDGNRQ